MSDENLPCSPEEWAHRVLNRYGVEVLVIGLGGKGALLCVRKDSFMERIPAVITRPVVNTIGAGDALFSAFVHTYFQTRDPYQPGNTAGCGVCLVENRGALSCRRVPDSQNGIFCPPLYPPDEDVSLGMGVSEGVGVRVSVGESVGVPMCEGISVGVSLGTEISVGKFMMGMGSLSG
jgi:hypothetical protein